MVIDLPIPLGLPMDIHTPKPWRGAVFYRIYPCSFQDTDGAGDLKVF